MKSSPWAIGLVALTMCLAGCDLYFSNLQIVNKADSRVVGLTISDGRKTWKLRDLDRGERVTFSGHLSGEGGPNISWTWRGRRFSEDGCYYTSGSPAKGTITIAGEKLRYRCQ
ncbi:hypothetical protein G7077_06915 [Sphingomonas piscis]|uniref:Uncharacterized protein n=1 Tax=Sphingomonas piscis TaxID=2714943 RepID=A0A6G7YPJ5_9SPHN|nr:hypothetical protein [Sphingomonas piscis]QIK78668.1 hypothetical protein G7077_06915 [Sphingomonas piscis]